MRNILILLFAFIGTQAHSKILYYGSETESLTLVNDTQTILRFDEEVKTVSQASQFQIDPADPTDPSYKVLAITPRSAKASSLITFILANDSVVSLRVKTVSQSIPEKTDNFYDFRSKESKVDSMSDGIQGNNITELELMKAMIRGDNIVGYTSKTLVKEVNTGIDGVIAHLVSVYSGPRFNGYIFKLENVSSKKDFAVDLKSLSLGRPNTAILSQVDEKILYAVGSSQGKSSSFLRIVAKPTSVYSNLFLPVAPLVVK
jgi:hypothetical protein